MNRTEIRANLRTFGGALALVMLILGAQAVVDRLERDTEDRLAYRAWVAAACTPRPGERAVANNVAGKLSCTIYSHAEYGLRPIVVSAAVMDSPL